MNDAQKTTSRPNQLPQRVARWLVVLAVAVLGAYLFGYWQAVSTKDLVTWQADLPQALSDAKTQDKPVLLLVTSNWCGACQALKAGVFSNDADADRITESFIPVKFLHGDLTPDQQAAFDRLNITGFPTLIALNPRGTEISRIEGYRSRLATLDWLNSAEAQSEVSAYAH